MDRPGNGGNDGMCRFHALTPATILCSRDETQQAGLEKRLEITGGEFAAFVVVRSRQAEILGQCGCNGGGIWPPRRLVRNGGKCNAHATALSFAETKRSSIQSPRSKSFSRKPH